MNGMRTSSAFTSLRNTKSNSHTSKLISSSKSGPAECNTEYKRHHTHVAQARPTPASCENIAWSIGAAGGTWNDECTSIDPCESECEPPSLYGDTPCVREKNACILRKHQTHSGIAQCSMSHLPGSPLCVQNLGLVCMLLRLNLPVRNPRPRKRPVRPLCDREISEMS